MMSRFSQIHVCGDAESLYLSARHQRDSLLLYDRGQLIAVTVELTLAAALTCLTYSEGLRELYLVIPCCVYMYTIMNSLVIPRVL